MVSRSRSEREIPELLWLAIINERQICCANTGLPAIPGRSMIWTLVQIMERPGIAGSPVLAQQICRSFIIASQSNSGISRSDLLRDTMKRLRRLLALVSFDAVDDTVLGNLVNHIFAES